VLLDEALAFVDKADTRNRAFPNSTPSNTRFLLAYHLCKSTLLIVRDPNGDISGLALWYRFKAPWTCDQITQWREDDKDGEDIVFSHLITTNGTARRMIVDEMRKRGAGSDGASVSALRKNRIIEFSTRNANRFRNAERN
jgi:hypothetical protein